MGPVRSTAVFGAALALLVTAAGAHAATSTETVTSGAVTATLTTTYTSDLDDVVVSDDLSLAIARSDGGSGATFAGEPAFAPYGPVGDHVARTGALRLVDLDGNGEPEVLVDLFTGGAHCCAVTFIAWRSPLTGAYELHDALWGNPAPRLRDLDRDGLPEFVGWDDRFAYAFGPYAATVFARRVWSFRDGRLVDATRSHRALARGAMKVTWREYLRFRRNGYPRASALAAYIANSYSAGGGYPAVAWRRAKALEREQPRMLRSIRGTLRRWGYIPG